MRVGRGSGEGEGRGRGKGGEGDGALPVARLSPAGRRLEAIIALAGKTARESGRQPA